MKRDMELVRQIALRVEALNGLDEFSSEEILIEGYSAEQVSYHCVLMLESNLIAAFDTTTSLSPHKTMIIRRLTTAGHDFIDAARSDTVWNKAISVAKEKGIGLTIEVTVQYLKAVTRELLGLN